MRLGLPGYQWRLRSRASPTTYPCSGTAIWWPTRRVALLHRSGHLVVGEASVVVAASAPHRAEAFEACRHGIEQLKVDVPIWKKESLASGEADWVMGA